MALSPSNYDQLESYINNLPVLDSLVSKTHYKLSGYGSQRVFEDVTEDSAGRVTSHLLIHFDPANASDVEAYKLGRARSVRISLSPSGQATGTFKGRAVNESAAWWEIFVDTAEEQDMIERLARAAFLG